LQKFIQKVDVEDLTSFNTYSIQWLHFIDDIDTA